MKTFKIGDVTNLGTVMDINESWNKETYKHPIYYVTKTPEKYKKGVGCGIWKLGTELTLVKDCCDCQEPFKHSRCDCGCHD